jgi:hypothetical protein
VLDHAEAEDLVEGFSREILLFHRTAQEPSVDKTVIVSCESRGALDGPWIRVDANDLATAPANDDRLGSTTTAEIENSVRRSEPTELHQLLELVGLEGDSILGDVGESAESYGEVPGQTA